MNLVFFLPSAEYTTSVTTPDIIDSAIVYPFGNSLWLTAGLRLGTTIIQYK